jgi:radical SAM/Cys-rich protein
VEAGPSRDDGITRDVLACCLRALEESSIEAVDATGGAPELHPDLRWFLEECRMRDRQVSLRTNLVALAETEFEDLARFLARLGIGVIASLPCYTEANVDRQRGRGVFARSIRALGILNGQGYGSGDPRLRLDLVYNPGGPALPAPQAALEADYKRELRERHGVSFDQLLALVNMPIGRFGRWLDRSGRKASYLELLARSFNPHTVPALMCRTILSVGPDGTIYDCDFNLALGLACDHGAPSRIQDFDAAVLGARRIVTGGHCFGCTAGDGSSCGGALA